MPVSDGHRVPLGATSDDHGVSFAIGSASATRVEICLFDTPGDARESRRVPLARSGNIWHCHVAGLRPGQLYGYSVDGSRDPALGHRHNPDLVLFDPYARAVGRRPAWVPTVVAPLAAVDDGRFDWDDDCRPATPWADTIIYEAHVKGFTARHPDVPADVRGTYLGLASPAALRHLRDLGVTAVELLPVHFCVDEPALARRGLTNYWGYNTLGFFAPDPRLASTTDPLGVVREFKAMVKALHRAGLEVILDVVYNHTAEGDHLGPTLSMRGIDNAGYYRLDPLDRSRYQDFSGCGNTLDTRSPLVEHLVLDSLRYWIEEMHVDGFRFDLASALIRGDREISPHPPLLDAIAQDPVISRVKLIAEPWDATLDGYRLGHFPAPWSEWNGRYRDDVRRYWRGDTAMRPPLATRLAGSSDLFAPPGRRPQASINFVTAHDGFTLVDLVSYAHKHNEANGEGNRDGESQNFSANWGVEGPTLSSEILDGRCRVQRSLLLTLLMSQGVPMISGGDELGRTQQGNNNAYCHDGPLSWTPWRLDDGADLPLLAFVRQVVALRQAHRALRRETFFNGSDAGRPDVRWLNQSGEELTAADWHDAGDPVLGMHLTGDGDAPAMLAMFHSGGQDIDVALPAIERGDWSVVAASGEAVVNDGALSMGRHSAAVLRFVARPAPPMT